jgi:hypothetical protein
VHRRHGPRWNQGDGGNSPLLAPLPATKHHCDRAGKGHGMTRFGTEADPCPICTDERRDHGLGVVRYVAEQTQALLHQFKRLRTRYDVRDDIHESFLDLACSVICWRRFRQGFF